ncbi:unnamed protein product [Ambrosiozyma monospora]|uniref:Unnamed protein product n=1 Tax=Ambrosiozyma monospora TaxID=43982 RepID=A0ACB5SZS0_AMBMO|nr:unnamed protein product [Ambrosiozyma monospora]
MRWSRVSSLLLHEISEVDIINAEEEARQLRLKRRQDSVLTTGVRNGELFCERGPANSENNCVNEIRQESVPTTMDIDAKRESNSIDREVVLNIQDITESQNEKQPLLPEDVSSQSNEAQTKKTSIVSIAISALSAVFSTITSFFSRYQDAQSTNSTVHNNSAECYAESLLDHLDWLDSICVQYAPLSIQHDIVKKQEPHADLIAKAFKVQADKTYGAVSVADDDGSTLVDSESEEVQKMDGCSDKTHGTVHNCESTYNSLLEELDWLDSVCIRFTCL